jgi:two-component system C4-dicarboxylate transport sensor histidine kinase DctB
LETVERDWQSLPDSVLVTDEHGIVFLTNRADWRLRPLSPLDDTVLQEIADDRRYGQIDLDPLLISTVASSPGEEPHWLLAPADGRDTDPIEFVSASREMADADWTLHVLANLANERWGVVTTAALALVSAALILLGGLVIWQRRRRFIERIDFEQAAAEQLERQAEDELRRTQADLVQAGKLAALGQMSAALSHEFNQPLAAIRTYAENATLLLDRSRLDEAAANMQHISDLTRRMAEISRHLNTFARRPDDRRVAVDLCAICKNVIALVDSKRQMTDATIELVAPSEPLWVTAGEVRLGLVIQNLLTNAVDAVSNQPVRQVTLTISIEGEWGVIRVADTGRGIEPAAIDRMFDPFFTTKRTGEGLGLGLSITYNIVKDFNGNLSAEDNQNGGATFTALLPLAKLSSKAAE